jgi:tRNA threonylcarbamoyladenosine modification (KEOPS) complex  Pcc1 subunit
MPGKQSSPVRCSITLEFNTGAEAEKVHRSVELDNEGYLETRVDGRTVVAKAEAESLKSLLHTLDDFLACVGVAERIVSKKD